jgi:hypothetical protein
MFGKYYLTHGTKYLVTWKNIFPCVHGWSKFKDENLDDKWKWMNFSWMLAILFFCEKLNKNNRVENIYVGLFLKFLTHEMLKSYFKSYFVFFQYEIFLRHLNHIEC